MGKFLAYCFYHCCADHRIDEASLMSSRGIDIVVSGLEFRWRCSTTPLLAKRARTTLFCAFMWGSHERFRRRTPRSSGGPYLSQLPPTARAAGLVSGRARFDAAGLPFAGHVFSLFPLKLLAPHLLDFPSLWGCIVGSGEKETAGF